MSPTVRVLALLLALALSACHLPNPYKAPPPPQQPQPAPGGTPNLPPPAPPPTQQPAPPPEPVEETPAPPPPREYQLSSATRSLVSQARTQAAAGNFAVAASSIERALRIEPNNPLLWIELGRVR